MAAPGARDNNEAATEGMPDQGETMLVHGVRRTGDRDRERVSER
jgi:hypothetical protein